jgi:hypothetical protein
VPRAAASRQAESAVPPRASTRRTIILVVVGIVIAGVATSIVALVAAVLGIAPGFAPLKPAVYLPFVAIGMIAAVVGWRIVGTRATHAAAVLRVLVPAALVASFIPDTLLIITRFIPGTTLLGGLSLSLMHVIVAVVAVATAQRVAPVRR